MFICTRKWRSNISLPLVAGAATPYFGPGAPDLDAEPDELQQGEHGDDRDVRHGWVPELGRLSARMAYRALCALSSCSTYSLQPYRLRSSHDRLHSCASRSWRWACGSRRKIFAGLQFDSPGTLLAAALLLGVVNAIVRPIAVILTLPLTLLTLGLFLLVINAAMLGLVALLLSGFQIGGFWTALGASLIVSITSWLPPA